MCVCVFVCVCVCVYVCECVCVYICKYTRIYILHRRPFRGPCHGRQSHLRARTPTRAFLRQNLHFCTITASRVSTERRPPSTRMQHSNTERSAGGRAGSTSRTQSRACERDGQREVGGGGGGGRKRESERKSRQNVAHAVARLRGRGGAYPINRINRQSARESERARERERACVCERERAREREESVRASERERERGERVRASKRESRQHNEHPY